MPKAVELSKIGSGTSSQVMDPKKTSMHRRYYGKKLILEARHSISIEASNEIRSKLEPRLFIKSFKTSRKTQEHAGKLKLQATEGSRQSKFQHLTRKLIIKSKYRQNLTCQKMADKDQMPSSCQNSRKILKNSNDFDQANQNNSINNRNSVTILKQDTTDARSCGNLKRIKKQNSADASKNLPTLFYYREVTMESSAAVNEDPSAIKNLSRNFSENIKEAAAVENVAITKTINKNNTPSDTATTGKRSFRPKKKITKLRKLNESLEQAEAQKERFNKIASGDIIHVNNSQSSATIINYKEDPNTLGIAQDYLSSNNENCLTPKENLQSTADKAHTFKLNTRTKGLAVKKVAALKKKLKMPKKFNNENTQNVRQKATTNAIKSYLRKRVAVVKDCLEMDLHKISTGTADFQQDVRSSISVIYDCSAIDHAINEDLIQLDETTERFAKFILQSYDTDKEIQKSYDCLEYLKQKYNKLKLNSSQVSSLNSLNNTEATLTIFIDAAEMPRKAITFKTSEILYSKTNSKINNELSLTTNDQNMINLENREISAEAESIVYNNSTAEKITHATKQQNQTSTAHATEMPNRSVDKILLFRKQLPAKIIKLSIPPTNTTFFNAAIQPTATGSTEDLEPPLTTDSNNKQQQHYARGVETAMFYTTANQMPTQHNYNPYNAALQRNVMMPQQVLTQTPVAAATNLYNYTLPTRNIICQINRSPEKLSENNRAPLYFYNYPVRHNFNIPAQPSLRQPAIANEYATQYYYHYQNSCVEVPYLQNSNQSSGYHLQ